MIKTWITWINYAIIATICCVLLIALFLVWSEPSAFSLHNTQAHKPELPKSAFARPSEDYNKIGPPALALSFAPLSAQLPDLRRHLIYYGKNGRPDADKEHPLMFFGFTGNKTPVAMSPGKRLYVLYDKIQNPPQYAFSPKNKVTPLWIEGSVQGNQALVKVEMKGENGEILNEPASYAEFTLPEKEFSRFGGGTWEIGEWRVDGTLLARQKARWYGNDLFLEKHGGDEFQDRVNKQRIDFGEEENSYSVYVAQGDCLIWDGARWQSDQPGQETLKSPLMCVKKIDDRIMNLELWDVEGKSKVLLNLIKIKEPWQPEVLEKAFKFIGARTRTQFIFEIDRKRMLLRPNDWLLQVDGKWKKLENPKDIDSYVDRKLVGPLFIFDSIDKKGDKQVILGTLFSSSRTEMVPIEIPLQQGAGAGSAVKDGGEEQHGPKNKRRLHRPDEEDDDDDDDMSDEYEGEYD